MDPLVRLRLQVPVERVGGIFGFVPLPDALIVNIFPSRLHVVSQLFKPLLAMVEMLQSFVGIYPGFRLSMPAIFRPVVMIVVISAR